MRNVRKGTGKWLSIITVVSIFLAGTSVSVPASVFGKPSEGPTGLTDPGVLQSIDIEDAITLDAGETKKLTISFTPSQTTDDFTVNWSSADKDVATVKDGVVTAVGNGTTVITAEAEECTSQCRVTVKGVAVEKVALNKQKATVKKGKKVTLKATVAPVNADNKNVTWKSSNKKIATVSSKGVVTAKKAGKVKITVKTKDGQKTAVCQITVKK